MSDKPIEGHAYIMSMANEIISLRAERDALRAAINKAVDDLAEMELEQEIYVGRVRIHLAAALKEKTDA